MELWRDRRSRAVGVIAAAAMAGTAFVAAPAAAATDPADGFTCSVQEWNGVLRTYCYDEVLKREATYWDDQWERDGVAIPGATSNVYEYKPEDMGHLFSATVGVDRDGTKVTIPIGRPGASSDGAHLLMEHCVVTMSGSGGGGGFLDGHRLNDTITLKILPAAVASSLTVEGPYWTMMNPSWDKYQLPPVLASQAKGWTVKLSDLASINDILAPTEHDGGIRGSVVVKNSFTVVGGDVSATYSGCPWGADTPFGALDVSEFGGSTDQRTPAFPIAGHVAGDKGVQGVLTANTAGWAPADAPGAASFTYQWTRDDKPIAGATSGSYTLTAEDSGKKIGLVVWGTVDGTTAWTWGEVTAGEIKAPPAGKTPPKASSPARSVAGLIALLLRLFLR